MTYDPSNELLWGPLGTMWETQEPAKKAEPKPPYPFCRTPKECAGKGYCPKEIACND